jgi:succinate-semialdehyde dehydrogenase / glutarate-semialdehyde dehydrogenase
MKTLPHFWFETHPWLNGQWHCGSETIAVSNPATGEMIADVTRADPPIVNLAISGAVSAQREWREVAAIQRGLVLKRTAALLLDRKDEFARLLTAEQGKPYAQAVGEVEYAASFFQWFGEETRRIYGRIAPHPEANREFFVEQRPAGVAGLVTPWNFPLAQGAKKIAAALAAGCSAVWKPAELTPLIALALGPLMTDAGLPAGVLQIVPGRGSVVGAVLAEHPAVRVLSLTGSTATGCSLMAAAAPGIKRVSLELGGNAPFIVLPDAKLEFVAEQLIRLKLFVSGQVCVTANRVFVHRDIQQKLIDVLAERLLDARVGNGLNDGIDAGPLIHHQACQDVGTMVDRAVASGARVVAQNFSFRDDDSLKLGSFFPPTLLADVQDHMAVSCREVFGPVIPLLSYSTVEEVIQRANDTPYGLAGFVYGSNLSQCHAIARRLEVGIVGVNEWRPLKAEIPFGGVKQSGIGAEGGEEGLREFLETQVISMPRPKTSL